MYVYATYFVIVTGVFAVRLETRSIWKVEKKNV